VVELISFFIQAGGPISKTHPLDDVLFKAAIETFGLFSPLLLDSFVHGIMLPTGSRWGFIVVMIYCFLTTSGNDMPQCGLDDSEGADVA